MKRTPGSRAAKRRRAAPARAKSPSFKKAAARARAMRTRKVVRTVAKKLARHAAPGRVIARRVTQKRKARPVPRTASRVSIRGELTRKTFRSRASLNGCSRRKLIAFAEGRMELDEKLDILYHLDNCQKCWDDLYLVRKSKNGQLYSRKTRSYSEADIKALEKESVTPDDEDALAEAEDAFDVA